MDRSIKDFRLLTNTSNRQPVSAIWLEVSTAEIDADLVRLIDEGAVELQRPDIIKYNFDRSGGSGTYCRYVLGDGVSVGIGDAVLPEATHQHFLADEPLLMVRASLASDCAYTVPGLPTMIFNRPEVVFAYVPLGSEILIDVNANARQQSVILFANAAKFLGHFELSREALPSMLHSLLDGTSATGRLITVPLDGRLAALVESMTQPLRNLALQRLAISGGLGELMALALDAAERNPAFAGATGLRERDLHMAHAARRLLDLNSTSPPLFSELAHTIGTNQKKLKVVFRQVFGTTMADYCVQSRMRLAQSLLLEGRLSVGQVAERVGYEHQSSFTWAFRSHAGITPKDYRRHRAALDVSLTATSGKPALGRRS